MKPMEPPQVLCETSLQTLVALYPYSPKTSTRYNGFKEAMIPSAQTRPEPMNSSPLHPKVKVSLTLGHPAYVAGKFVAGKMEVECRADRGLGVSTIMVELFAVQELTSRDHSATSTFLHSRRLFQGPDLPPSNAVQAHPLPGDPPYPPDYHQALRGISTFLFRIPLPSSCPSSINFGSDLARVRYELCATVGVIWKGEKTLVVCKREIDVVEGVEDDITRTIPEGIVVGEFGKIWVQGSVVGGMIIAGESACLELQVKNHSDKRNTGLTLSLTRSLVLPGSTSGETSLLEISDNLTTVSFRGPDYNITPGAEGVASLIFDVPDHARGVRAGPYEGGDLDYRSCESIFEVRCILGITINMELGTKDIHLDIPITIAHPDALPEPEEFTGYPPPDLVPLPQHLQSPYALSELSIIPPAYINPVQDQVQVWLPPSESHTPHIDDIYHLSPPIDGVEPRYYFLPSPHVDIPYVMTTQPTDQFLASYEPGYAKFSPPMTFQPLPNPFDDIEPEEGKGERATRVTQHLRMSSRHRSVSPQSHRFPLPIPPTGVKQISPSWAEQLKFDDFQSPLHAPLLLPSVSSSLEPFVHATFPFHSPKRSNNSSSTSDYVEEPECMTEEARKPIVHLASDSPKTTSEAYDSEAVPALSPVGPAEAQGSQATELAINQTLSVPPPVTKKAKAKKAKDKAVTPSGGRTRIDEFFANASPILTELKAPKTPMAAVTPVKLPSKPKSTEFRMQLDSSGREESGLDALEKRLLAEVGTRKMELASERRPAWSGVGAKPIDIPSKDSVPDDPMNDSAISSLTLAGERMGFDREEVELNGVSDDAEHDSDEKTHRAGKSTASAGSRKGSKDKGEKVKKKGKSKDRTQDRGQDGESYPGRKKKTAAAKGRVAAWLGAIDPDVPPVEDVLPPSPAVSRNLTSFVESKEVTFPVVGSDVPSLASKSLNDVEPTDIPNDNASAPNPRSSGFVPIGTFKSGIHAPLNPPSSDATVVREAQRVSDIWSSSTSTSNVVAPLMVTPPDNQQYRLPLFKDAPPAVSSLVPIPQGAPHATAGTIDILEANHYNIDAGKAPNVKFESPNSSKTMQTSHLAALPTPQCNQEAKYNLQSARGGRGGRVTAISSLWATGGVGCSIEPTTNLAPFKPLRNCAPDPAVKCIPAKATTPRLPEQSSVKSLLTASAPTIPPQNLEHNSVESVSKGPRSIVKSTSVPAIISSSHATPTLSSTASLARPTSAKPHAAPKLPPVLSEPRPDSGRQTLGQTSPKFALSSSVHGTTGGDMAFGQARLRDLIKKYQGHAL
ncbi:hypothetical protein C0992_002491 [Termitomyces sp. T32_za158]|nr:hypothetical protein C0992_002491 [Termitomyces sp. T32_za158]